MPDERILVHCSAGKGRTGTLIAVFLIAEHLLNLSETIFPSSNQNETGFKEEREEPDEFYTDFDLSGNNKTWARISIFSLVRRLREQRWGMVSTEAQYAYVYKFAQAWIANGETARTRSELDRLYKMPSSCIL